LKILGTLHPVSLTDIILPDGVLLAHYTIKSHRQGQGNHSPYRAPGTQIMKVLPGTLTILNIAFLEIQVKQE